MGKNITLKQLNKSSTYDELYPAGTIDYTMLTETTSAAYGVKNGSVKDALNGLYQYIHSSDVIKIKVVDVSNNPLPNIMVNGIVGTPQTGADGIVKGVSSGNSVTLVSPYVDTIKTKTVDVSKYKNTTRLLTVTMDSVVDGAIVRYTSSQNVMFSSRVANIDVCCVGGGGSGGGLSQMVYNGIFGGGGGGGIVNSIGITPQFAESYSIIVGSGGTYNHSSNGSSGGTSSFGNLLTAFGGGGGTLNTGGTAGSTGCGAGGGNGNGQSNTTISEFGDNLTFYSGGGGSGSTINTVPSGGSPNGASGSTMQKGGIDAGSAGIGGGGGGASGVANSSSNPSYWSYQAKGSSGGPGLVAIKIHLKS